MTSQDLDRLVSRTKLTPLTKKALRNVRRGIIAGRVGEPEMLGAHWSIGVDSEFGQPVRVTFTFKQDG